VAGRGGPQLATVRWISVLIERGRILVQENILRISIVRYSYKYLFYLSDHCVYL
jgi:hypothetical protein